MIKPPEIIYIDSEDEYEVITKPNYSNSSISNVNKSVIQFDLNVDPTLQSPEKPDEASLPVTTKYLFACTFCPKRFKNLQALGGHQNRHKSERSIKKRVDLLRMLSLGGLTTGANIASVGMQANALDHHFPGPSSGIMPNNFNEGKAESIAGHNLRLFPEEGRNEMFCPTSVRGTTKENYDVVEITNSTQVDLTLKL